MDRFDIGAVTPDRLYKYVEECEDQVRSLCSVTKSETMFSSSFRFDLGMCTNQLKDHFIFQDGRECLVCVLLLTSSMYKAIPEGSSHRVTGMRVLMDFAVKRDIPLDKLSMLTEEIV